MSQETDQHKKELRDQYLHERDSYNKTLSEESDKYDKNMVFVASGSFVITFSFLRNIVPKDKEVIGTPWMLVLAWAAMLASLIVILFSFLSAIEFQRQRIQRRTTQLKNMDREEHSELPLIIKKYRWANSTLNLNYVSVFFLIAGLVLFIIYLWRNLVP